MALTLIGFVVACQWDRERLENRLSDDAEQMAAAVRRSIESNLDTVESLGDLYDSGAFVSRGKFSQFAASCIARHPEVQALEWIPRVAEADRARYEESARADGLTEFRITDRAAQGNMVPAPPRDEYYPVYYVEPYRGNEIALGFDLGAGPVRRQTLELARESRQAAASPRLVLVQEKAQQYGFLVVRPIHDRKAERPLLGFVLGVFRVQNILGHALGGRTRDAINVHLFDESAPDGERYLGSYFAAAARTVTIPASEQDVRQDRPRYATSFPLAGRQWRIVCVPTAAYLAGVQDHRRWAVLGVGLLAVLGLGVYYIRMARRNANVGALARELGATNKQLLRENQERRSAEQRYCSLFQDSPVGLWEVDCSLIKPTIDRLRRSGVTDFARYFDEHAEMLEACAGLFCVSAANQAALALAEAGSVDELWAHLPRLMREDSFGVLKTHLVDLAEGRFGRWSDAKVHTLTGQSRWLSFNWALPAGSADTWSKVLMAIQDVTEHKRLEEQFRQAQKMEAVGQLAGGIAHDFNNILTGISGFAQLGLEDLPADHAAADGLREICQLTDRAASLTHQLLAFSRRQPLQQKAVDLNQLVGRTSAMLARLLGENVALEFMASTEPATVGADPNRIEQVLVNLAVNARDAMPHGGKLTVETANILFETEAAGRRVGLPAGRYVMIAVSDTGTGMDEATKARAFEPFFTTKPVGKGTGLGLATVYGIVKQHGGSIWLYSEPGRGTTFKIYLPAAAESAAEPEAPSAAPAAPAPAPPAKAAILLVEDESAVRGLIQRVLGKQGYEVLAAGCAEEAEDLLSAPANAGRVALLLSDMIMPGRTGLELYRSLRLENPELKVLLMSGYTRNAAMRQVRLADSAADGVPFVEKPFTPAALVERVRQVLAGEAPNNDRRGRLSSNEKAR